MNKSAIAHYRLYNQMISRSTCQSPAEVVSWLGAMQGQDYPGSKWAIGLRMSDTTESDIDKAIEEGSIIRTYALRGTLHFVAATDIRWILSLVGPRALAAAAGYYRKNELDDTVLKKTAAVIKRTLKGGKQLTKEEIMEVLEKNSIDTSGLRSNLILSHAALTQVICFGPRRGKQLTFMLLDELVPPAKAVSRETALKELAIRYFQSHGPATIKDFVWWSGLNGTDAKAALTLTGNTFREISIDGETYWLPQNMPDVKDIPAGTWLLPGFDEFLLGYTNRSAVVTPHHFNSIVTVGNGIFSPTIVTKDHVSGCWKRTIKKDKALIELQPFTAYNKTQIAAISKAMKGYEKFMEIKTEILT